MLRAEEKLREIIDENSDIVYTHQVDDEIRVITEEEYLEEYRKYPASQVVNFSKID